MRQVQAGQQGAVDEANHAAGHDSDEDQHDAAGNAGFLQSTHQASAENGVSTHGQVDTGSDQAQQHTNRQEGVESRLLEDTHDVAGAVEVGVGDRQKYAHDHQCQDCAQLKAGAALFLSLSHLKFLPMPLS